MDTSPRIAIPQFRIAPPELVARLREIEPLAELVYLGQGKWFLGTLAPTPVRYRAGARKVSAAHRLKPQNAADMARALWMHYEGSLLLQGFAGWQIFTGEPDSAIEEYARLRSYQWDKEVDRQLARVEWEARQSPAALAQKDDAEDNAALYSTVYEESRLREAHRWAFKRPVSVQMHANSPVMRGVA